MKVFFDTNVYVAEALLGETAEAFVHATQRANWRIVTNTHVLDEMRRVLAEYFGYPVRFASLTRHRIGRRADIVEPTTSRHIAERGAAGYPFVRMESESAHLRDNAELILVDRIEPNHQRRLESHSQT